MPVSRRTSPHSSRYRPKTPPITQVPLDMASDSSPASDMSWFLTTVARMPLMSTMPTASTNSTIAATNATGLRTTVLTPCYLQYVR